MFVIVVYRLRLYDIQKKGLKETFRNREGERGKNKKLNQYPVSLTETQSGYQAPNIQKETTTHTNKQNAIQI